MKPFAEPEISILMPVFNGGQYLDRSINSLREQDVHDWELLAVDDASKDDSYDRLLSHAAEDARIRVFRLPTNQGPYPARNLGLREARASLIAYLDCDDEFYPGYLNRVIEKLADADVLVSAYDVIEDRPGQPGFGKSYDWNPADARERLMNEHIAVPLGIAHRRNVVKLVGMFDENWYVEGETDYLRRLFQAGAKFLYVSDKSGRYHVRSGGRGRSRFVPQSVLDRFPMAAREPAAVAERTCRIVGWTPSRSCWNDEELQRQTSGRKLLFASYHCYFDTSNGASLCTRDLFELLAERGWHCRVLCGPHLDFEQHESIDQLLADDRLDYDRQEGKAGPIPYSLYRFQQRKVPVGIYSSPIARRGHEPTREEGYAFLAVLEQVLDQFRPDALFTYGGDWLSRAVIQCAKTRGIPVYFALHNFAYRDASLFQPIDAVIVPSKLAKDYYRRKLGIQCTALPGPWNLDRVICESLDRKYVTFVNPQPHKGVYVFARIVHEMWRRRPDIPFLVVEGRGKASWLTRTGLDLREARNCFVMANTPDPRDFYRVSKVVLMPSLGFESFSRVGVESMLNGIPILGTRRGGLKESFKDAGILIDVPNRYSPVSRDVLSVEEVEPWINTIIRLWDDADYYERERQKCLAAAESWRPEILVPQFEALFEQHLSDRQATPDSASENARMQRSALAFAQATASSDQMTPTQYFRIAQEIQRRVPCRLLVFGAGRDTDLYTLTNVGGRTVVLEHDPVWIERTKHLGCELLPVSYCTRVGDGLVEPCPLPGGLSDTILNEKWDIIIVDGPEGYEPEQPGRQQSIHLASRLARPGCTIFLHDAERPLEQVCAERYLKEPDELFGETRVLNVYCY